jgi:DNA-directed RNA polymerase specialized sigma24 family protein
MDLEALVRAAAGGDLDAFADLTRRFQHMAFGYALSFVRDLGQAEDVVQAVAMSCLGAAEAAQLPHRWRGTGSGSISAAPSPTSPSSTRRPASWSN